MSTMVQRIDALQSILSWLHAERLRCGPSATFKSVCLFKQLIPENIHPDIPRADSSGNAVPLLRVAAERPIGVGGKKGVMGKKGSELGCSVYRILGEN